MKISAIVLLLAACSPGVIAIKKLQRQHSREDFEDAAIPDVLADAAKASGEEQTLWQRILEDSGMSLPPTGKTTSE